MAAATREERGGRVGEDDMTEGDGSWVGGAGEEVGLDEVPEGGVVNAG